MVETSHSPLAGHAEPGRYGARPDAAPGVTLAERRGLEIALLAAFPGEAAAAESVVRQVLDLRPPAAGRAESGPQGQCLWQGPERWLLLAPEGTSLAAALESAIAEAPLTVTDLSHARTILRVEGPQARTLLAKEVPLDLAPGAFPDGSVAMTRFGQLAVTLLADGPETLELLAFRSFGLALFEELADRALELGYAVAPPVEG